MSATHSIPAASLIVTVSHPLARHFLTHLRDKTTKPALFRTLVKKLSLLLALEAARELETEATTIDTPLEKTTGAILAEEIVIVPILRAGLGMFDPIMELFPNVSVGYVGIERNEQTALPSEYYAKMPNLEGKVVFVTDPMLATGGSASYAISMIKRGNPKRIFLLSVVSAPEGIEYIRKEHPDVKIFTTAIDRCLNERKYILPGLGDCGDRLYGTED
jgi:uracil phosphoribosyltransferase